MNVLIILGHPDKKSFNHAIAEACKAQVKTNGHSVVFHDLYAENFIPLRSVGTNTADAANDELTRIHCSDIIQCDAIIVIHPNWWGQPPAIVKGWMDRVLLPGVAYHFVKNDNGQSVPTGMLKAAQAIVFNTSNAPCHSDQDPMDSIWKNSVFKVCGVDRVDRRNFYPVKASTDMQRAGWLLDVQEMINRHLPKKQIL